MGITAEIFRGILERGFRISFSTGPVFDPSQQVRTTPFQDEQKRRKAKECRKAKEAEDELGSIQDIRLD